MRVALLNAEVVSCRKKTGKSGYPYLEIVVREQDNTITNLCDTNPDHEGRYVPGDTGTFFLSVVSSQKFGTSIRVDRYVRGNSVVIARAEYDSDPDAEEWTRIYPM